MNSENNKPLSAAQPVSDGTPDVRPQELGKAPACECPLRSNETAVVERRYALRDRYHAVVLAIHAIDYIRNSDVPFVDKANACETLADGVMNALDGRATGREFRTARHSRLAKQDPQYHPVVSEEDRRCHDCGAVKPEPFSHCWQHRASAPCPCVKLREKYECWHGSTQELGQDYFQLKQEFEKLQQRTGVREADVAQELAKAAMIARAAEDVAAFDWGTSVSEQAHARRIAAMDRLRAVLAKEGK